MCVSRNLRRWTVAVAAATLAAIPTYAQEAPPGFPAARWDLAIELPSWPALQDLRPAGGGSFDSVGFGIGGAWHVPVKTFNNSELLVGTEISIAATGSDIAGIYEDLLARQFLLGLSAKWLLGSARNFSFDGGIGYYEYSRECMGPALKFVLPGNDDSNGAESVVRTFMYATSASRYRT